MATIVAPPAEPLFVRGSAGPLFAIYHPPADVGTARRDVLYVHPLGEETNISRRQIARQARRLATNGWGVLLLDLYGCGDSSGEFRDARWDIWRQDLALGQQWLRASGATTSTLWGIGLGALLALEHAVARPGCADGLVLWHPVASGEQAITRFLSLGLAAEGLSGTSVHRRTVQDVHACLRAGTAVEVAGYELSPGLVRALDSVHLAPLGMRATVPIHWVDAVRSPGDPANSWSLRTIEHWRGAGVAVHTHTVVHRPLQHGVDRYDESEMGEVMRRVFGSLR